MSGLYYIMSTSEAPSMSTLQSESPYFAAIDLGSNSFHMLIVRVNDLKLDIIDREKEMVQIARGLNTQGMLEEATIERALACLKKFSERLRDIPLSQIRAVGTKTLRSAQNSAAFLKNAEKALGAPIQIISGYEEARLIYTGLYHSIATDDHQRLIIDIGGASTELVLGKEQEPTLLESLSLGCASFTNNIIQRYGGVNEKSMRQVIMASSAAVENIRKAYLKSDWHIAFGTSGTIKAIAELVAADDGGAYISRQSLENLIKKTIAHGGVQDESIPKLRREVLPAGMAILHAIFTQLNLEKIHVADSTLKEGLIYDTIGRFSDYDAREVSVQKLKTQYQIDDLQSERVAESAVSLCRQKDGPILIGISRTKLLKWAAELHEIGLAISHSGHHNHGYYLLRHTDIAGFSRYEQYVLANLVRFHRKKINLSSITGLNEEAVASFIPLLLCLRIAVCIHRRREDIKTATRLSFEHGYYQLIFEKDWLKNNPLTHAGLKQEASYFKRIGIELKIGIEEIIDIEK